MDPVPKEEKHKIDILGNCRGRTSRNVFLLSSLHGLGGQHDVFVSSQEQIPVRVHHRNSLEAQ